MGTTNLESLKARIGEAPRNGQGHRIYPDELKVDIVRYGRGRARQGASRNAIARELGISTDTINYWLGTRSKRAPARTKRSASMRRVRIATATVPSEAAVARGREPVMVLPTGIRIEGLG